MNRYCRILIVLAGLAASANVSRAAIMSAETRAKNLEDIRSVLSNKVRPVSGELTGRSLNPFVPEVEEVVAIEAEAEVVLTDEELLGELSRYVNPTGIFMFGGEFYLVFKEKKLKVDSELGIKFNGVDYGVTITEITGSTYRIRRGDSELQLKLK